MADRVIKVTLTAQVAQYAAAFEEAARKTRDVGTEAEKAAQKRQAFQSLGTAAVVVGGAMTALSAAVAKTGIEYNTLQQTSRAALSTLLGGAEAAAAQMDRLDEFARSSPFSKQTFITAQQQMLAFGIESRKVIPYLDAIQEAVAAAGGSSQQLGEVAFVMAQISAAGKITGQDLIQFGQRGINAAELIGASMGKTGAQIKAEITAGTLDADAALDALAAGMKSKFDGASAAVKDTFGGAMDRVQAAWRDLSADLMKPLVDPNGGGALVGLLNWSADILRAFQGLPDPIKQVSGALFAVVGVVGLVGGAALLAVPKIVEVRTALSTLGVTGATVRGKLSGLVSFLGGPWGVAMLAATAAIVATTRAIEENKASSEELQAAFSATGRTAESMWATTKKGAVELGFAGSSLEKIQDVVDHLDGKDWNQFAFFFAADDIRLTADRIKDASVELGLLAQTDLSGAIAGFQEYAKGLDGSEKSIYGLMGAMPEFKSQLIAAATEAGVYSESMSDAQKQSALLEFATNGAADASTDAASAYRQQAQAASGLADDLMKLIDTINTSNGVARDAVKANAAWLEGLEQVGRLVEENGTSLDQSTAAGAANAAMLADLAAKSEQAAEAQFMQDVATMGAEEATSKYLSTLTAQREAFIQAATAAGFSREEVIALADAVLAMPSQKEIDILVDTATAQAAIDNFVWMNHGKRITITADVNYQAPSGITVTPNATGGVYEKAFAAGGFEPGIYPYTPGGIHKFAEEYGEAYISMDPARRERSYGVWTETGERLGFTAGSSDRIVDTLMGLRGDVNRLQGSLERPNVGIYNPVVEDVKRSAREAAQIAGISV